MRYYVPVFLIAGSLWLFLAIACSGNQSPQSGDHWHASYSINICGREQVPLLRFDGELHTHGDGVIHVHPTPSSGSGEDATLTQFFENAGGYLSERSLKLPGDRPWQRGGLCPDGRPGKVVVVVNEGPLGNGLDTYVPHDGDLILIAFVPSGNPTPPLPPPRAAAIE